MKKNNKLPITKWSLDDRPREKLLQKGVESLSNAELIAILIGSGSREISAVDLSKQILSDVQNNLNELGKYSIKDLMKFKGIGEAKAISIISALELGRRRNLSGALQQPEIHSSKEAFNILHPILSDLNLEEFWAILLRKNKVIKVRKISTGGLDASMVDIRLLMKTLLENDATSFIVAHNHPSGNRNPSVNDKNLTNKIKDASKVLNIQFLDHIIIAKNQYFSFVDEAIL